MVGISEVKEGGRQMPRAVICFKNTDYIEVDLKGNDKVLWVNIFDDDDFLIDQIFSDRHRDDSLKESKKSVINTILEEDSDD
jgi:hypothetical protein